MTSAQENDTNNAGNNSPTLFKTLIPISIILATAVIGLIIIKSQVAHRLGRPGHSDIQAGAKVPAFELQGFQHDAIRSENIKAKAVLIAFWATWCETCIQEMPSLVRMRNTYKDRGLEVLLINVDENPTAALPRFLKRHGIDFTVYLDPQAKLTELFDVHAIPLHAMLGPLNPDKTRDVLMVRDGEVDWDSTEAKKLLNAWLSEQRSTQ